MLRASEATEFERLFRSGRFHIYMGTWSLLFALAVGSALFEVLRNSVRSPADAVAVSCSLSCDSYVSDTGVQGGWVEGTLRTWSEPPH